MLDEIRHCILATDLALFFENRPKLEKVVDQNQFDWHNRDHLWVHSSSVSSYWSACFRDSCDLLYIFFRDPLIWFVIVFFSGLLYILISRLLVMGLSMTAADLCSSFKHWAVQRLNVSIIMEEFFQQVIWFLQDLFLSLFLSAIHAFCSFYVNSFVTIQITFTNPRQSRLTKLFLFQSISAISINDSSWFVCDV